MRTTSIVLGALVLIAFVLLNFYAFLELVRFFRERAQLRREGLHTNGHHNDTGHKHETSTSTSTSTAESTTSVALTTTSESPTTPLDTTTTLRITTRITSRRPIHHIPDSSRRRPYIYVHHLKHYPEPPVLLPTTSSTTTTTSTTTATPETTTSMATTTTRRIHHQNEHHRVHPYGHHIDRIITHPSTYRYPYRTEPTTTTTSAATSTSRQLQTSTYLTPSTLPYHPRQHHHHQHHQHQQQQHHHHQHHQHHHHTTTTPTPTSTTTMPVTEVVSLSSSLSTSSLSTSSVSSPSTLLSSPSTTLSQRPTLPEVVETDLTRQRQPEPTTAKVASLEREVTIVTALVDIGRGDWWEYRRPLDKYHQFMENLLSLKNNLVVFTDRNSYDFVHKYRKNMGLMHVTRIHEITLDDLPLYRYLHDAQNIIDSEHKSDTFYSIVGDDDMKHHPEAKSAEYDVLVNSKTYFLHNVTIDNPFGTDYFVWLDAGYGHGNQSVFPYDNMWRPAFPEGKISLIKLTPTYDHLPAYNIDTLYRKNWAVLSGGFIAGDKHSIGQLHSLVHRRFIQLIYQQKVDDDQTVLVLVVNSYPHLFSIVHGDWFDAFRLFSVDAERQFG